MDTYDELQRPQSPGDTSAHPTSNTTKYTPTPAGDNDLLHPPADTHHPTGDHTRTVRFGTARPSICSDASSNRSDRNDTSPDVPLKRVATPPPPLKHSSAQALKRRRSSDAGSYADTDDEGRPVSAPFALRVPDADGPNVDTISESITDGSASASSAGSGKSGRNAGTSTLRCVGMKFRIPFTAWTFLAMLVPIAMLVGINSANLAANMRELVLIDTHAPISEVVRDCGRWLMHEREAMGPWLARGLPADAANLAVFRDKTDGECVQHLTSELQKLVSASISDVWTTEMNRHVSLLRELERWRERVDTRQVDGRQARGFFTAAVTATAEILMSIADLLTIYERPFSELRLMMGARNHLWLAGGLGDVIAASEPAATTPSATMVQEYIAAHAKAQLAFDFLLGMAEPVLRSEIDAWAASPESVKLWQLLDTMADVPGGGVGVIQRDNATTWWRNIEAGLDALLHAQTNHLARLTAAETVHADVLQSALLMAFGVLVCFTAAGLLALQQLRVQRQLQDQVARIEKTRKAVSAFVPRFFLNKMGYTSITQVRAGESTNVALAMLFSDIRRFTTVSEGMESTELFEWVQGYFQRMTTIVEGRRGNVNEFIGDAMFAVFTTCNDSVQCAVDMQADVEQLNVLRLRDNASVIPIEVGVGIHHDVVALGILGDSHRHTCTAISASVNLASRLEGLTKQLGVKIIASEAVVQHLSAEELATVRMRLLAPVVVKGSQAKLQVYDVYHSDPRNLQLFKTATLDSFNALVAACLVQRPSNVQRDLRVALRAHVKGHTGGGPNPEGELRAPVIDGGEDKILAPTPQAFRLPQTPQAEEGRSARPSTTTSVAGSDRDGGHDAGDVLPPAYVATDAQFSSPPPSVVAAIASHSQNRSASHRAALAASIATVIAALREHDVRDHALEAITALADGSGALRFIAK